MINYIANFFYRVKLTFTSIEYYARLSTLPFRSSFTFFYIYFTLFAFISSLIIISMLIPPLDRFIKGLPDMIESLYPSDLVITIKDGQLSTNMDEPWVFPLKTFLGASRDFSHLDLKGISSPENILVIDPNAVYSNFHTYNTLFLMTRTSLLFKMDNRIDAFSFKKLDDILINRHSVRELIHKYSPYLGYVIPILKWTIILSSLLLLPLFKLIYALFISFIFFAITRTLNLSITYQFISQCVMHLLIVTSTTLLVVGELLNIPIYFPFLETLLLSLLWFIVFRKVRVRLTGVSDRIP